MITTRWSRHSDAQTLARIYREAWRYAYAGLIPGLTLERMVARRGATWWGRRHGPRAHVLVVELDGEIRGYAMLGPCRSRRFRCAGEIYELYIDPVCHGAGLGRALFEAARHWLDQQTHDDLIVWSLAVNEIGCRFYRALGGRPAAHGRVRLGETTFERIAYIWS